jgi:hypothetical protein
MILAASFDTLRLYPMPKEIPMLVRDIAYLENLDQSLSVSGGRQFKSYRSILIGEGSLQVKRNGQVLYNRALPSLPINVSFSFDDESSVTSYERSETRSGVRTALATAGISQNGSAFSYSSSTISM